MADRRKRDPDLKPLRSSTIVDLSASDGPEPSPYEPHSVGLLRPGDSGDDGDDAPATNDDDPDEDQEAIDRKRKG